MVPDADARVKLVRDDGTIYPHPGRLLFSDATVDPMTGQVMLRGEFPNPEHELLPGMYVRVQIVQGVDSDALAVPQALDSLDHLAAARVESPRDARARGKDLRGIVAAILQHLQDGVPVLLDEARIEQTVSSFPACYFRRLA